MTRPSFLRDTSGGKSWESGQLISGSESPMSERTGIMSLSTFGMSIVTKNTFLVFADTEADLSSKVWTTSECLARSKSAPLLTTPGSGAAQGSLSGEALRELYCNLMRNYQGTLSNADNDFKHPTASAYSTEFQPSSESDICDSPASTEATVISLYRAVDTKTSSKPTHHPKRGPDEVAGVSRSQHVRSEDVVKQWLQHQEENRKKELESVMMETSQQALHFLHQCTPCQYQNSVRGCLNGSNCNMCHLHQPKKKKNRPRPCKAKRIQCKQLVGMLHTAFGEETQEFQSESARLSTGSAYIRAILQSPAWNKGKSHSMVDGAHHDQPLSIEQEMSDTL